MTTSASALADRRPGPRRPRIYGVVLAAVLIAAGSYAMTLVRPVPTSTPAPAAQAAPVAPPAAVAPDAAPVGVPGTAAGGFAPEGSIPQIDHSIAAWTANLAANAHDYISATNLATLYHARGRLSADLGDQQKALAAVATALAIEPTDPTARELEATIKYTIHDFSGAFAEADALYGADKTQLGALATRLDAELELGRIGDARSDLATLSKATSGPAVEVRAARLAFVTGDGAKALAYAQASLVAAAKDPDIDLGFYAYAVGEYARLAGDAKDARAAYVQALAVRATDIGSIIGLARIEAFEGHAAAAIAGLRKAAAIAPQPETLGLLGDLLVAAGDDAAAAPQYATVRFVERLGEIQSTVFDRVLLRFEVDHGGASDVVLAKARASLAARPDTTGHDAVAWALYRLGRFDEASVEITLAAADGAADARLLYHAGAIDLARGDVTAGRAALTRALVLGPALDPAERAEAARLLGR
jgi:tetratricopeptide (TPR) repeat protein